MIVSYDILTGGALPPVVIIGSGPAGIALALRLEARGIDCLLLEGGGEEYSDESQSIYTGTVEGEEYYDLDHARLRYFGGSGNHWGGWARPLDAHDFDARDDLGLAGWPISKADLDPFEADVNEFLGVEATTSYPVSDDLREVTFSFSTLFFGEAFLDRVRASEKIKLLLNANVTSMRAEGGRIAGLTVETFDGRSFDLAPRTVVVACGGIENARLLLWSNVVSPEPVVPVADTLGRYWMEHPLPLVGESYITGHLSQHWNKTYDGFYRFAHLAFFVLTEEAMRRYGTLSARIRLQQTFYNDNKMKDLAKRGMCSTAGRRVDYLPKKAGKMCLQKVKLEIEQAARPDNRVALSEVDRDAFAVPRPVLHFRKSELDHHTIKVTTELCGRHLVENGLGMMRVHPQVIDGTGYETDGHFYGYHHMGGTRMSDTPETGVVDRDLKIHNIANGYVLGSSVYPRGGQANPTFTIAQLAMRLGDHLAKTL